MTTIIEQFTNLDSKLTKALEFANFCFNDLKLKKYYKTYYNMISGKDDDIHVNVNYEDSYCRISKSGTQLIVGCYYKQINCRSIDIYSDFWFDVELQKVIAFRSSQFSIYFMDDEIRIDKEWYTYKEIEECSFQVSTVHNGLEFILSVRHDLNV